MRSEWTAPNVKSLLLAGTSVSYESGWKVTRRFRWKRCRTVSFDAFYCQQITFSSQRPISSWSSSDSCSHAARVICLECVCHSPKSSAAGMRDPLVGPESINQFTENMQLCALCGAQPKFYGRPLTQSSLRNVQIARFPAKNDERCRTAHIVCHSTQL